MAYNVRPGIDAVITNSLSGEKGPSVGHRVRVHADAPVNNPAADAEYSDQFNALNDPHHYCPPSPYEKEHTVLDKIWPVTRLNGKPFADQHGNLREYIDVPDQWLRPVPPEPATPITKTEQLDLPTNVA